MTELNAVAGSDNVFRDLGFREAKAQNLLLRTDLVIVIRKVIDKLGVTQAEAAKRAGITQPRMNDLVKGRTQNSHLTRWLRLHQVLVIRCSSSLKK